MRSCPRRLTLAAAFALAPMAAQAGAPDTAPIPPVRASAPLPALPAAPTRVGRLSLVSGAVGFRAAGAAEWSPAAVNLPIAAGAALRTEPQARAAIEIGPHALALAPGSEVDIAGLDWQRIALALPQGRLHLHLRRLGAGETVAIAVPRGGVRLSTPGTYDIDLGSPNRPARIMVFSGSARFSGGGAETTVLAGKTAVPASTARPNGSFWVRGDSDGGAKPAAAPIGTAAADAFDSWAQSQDYRQATLAAPYFISPEMTGYAALDGHGQWEKSTEYGALWHPDGLPPNWAPYRDGHWRRIAPWGWTWIDDQPWGFAPFHYGRWVVIGKGWAWVPGRFVAHPAYVPAAVAFLGTPGVGLSVAGSSVPAIGWFPLAPGEVYWPSYSRDLATVRRLNRGDVADPAAIALNPDGNPPVAIVTGHFANRQMASVVPRPDFVAGRPVAAALLQIPEERLRDAPVIAGSPRLGPAAAPRPEVAVAGAAPASAAKRKPETVAARKTTRPVRAATRRVVVVQIVRPRPTVRHERHGQLAHLRAPAYEGHGLRLRRFVVYHPTRAVRRVHHHQAAR